MNWKLLLICLLGYSTARSQSVLRVRLADNSRFSVSVNGRYFNKRGTAITVGDLPAGKHTLRIFKIVRDRRGRAYENAIFEGTVVTHDGMTTQFTYDTYADRVRSRDYNTDREAEGPSYMDGVRPDASAHPSEERIDNSKTYSKSDKYAKKLNEPEPPVAASESGVQEKAASTTDERLKEKVKAKRTDTDRLKLLKSELKREKVTTDQVAEMMDWLLFESTRVELMKWIYPITIDKANFTSLLSKLEYKSSKEEMQQFLNQQ